MNLNLNLKLREGEKIFGIDMSKLWIKWDWCCVICVVFNKYNWKK